MTPDVGAGPEGIGERQESRRDEEQRRKVVDAGDAVTQRPPEHLIEDHGRDQREEDGADDAAAHVERIESPTHGAGPRRGAGRLELRRADRASFQ